MPSAASDDDTNLWSRVLDEVQSRSSNNFPQASILVLGDNESGKTTLIARLRNNEDPKTGGGLEYHYLDVNPDYKDGSYAYQLGSALPDVGPGESARLGVWILDGDPVHASLIRYALKSAQIDKCVVLLCASMMHPWSILDSLKKWARLLQDHVDRSSSYDKSQLRDAKDRQVRFWQEYLEPLDSSTHSESGAKVPSMETDTSQILLPLGETTLVENLGLPVIVIITKCDYMPSLEKEFDFKDEQFDFVQYNIRQFCLNYGAALVYTSVKEGRNCDLLYKYILHRIYGFPFTQPAVVVEKDSVFIPSGWDNEKKIAILTENFSTVQPSNEYCDVIKKPVLVKRPVTRDQEISAEDEQSFLAKQLQVLNTQAPPPAAAAAPATPGRTGSTGAPISTLPVPVFKTSPAGAGLATAPAGTVAGVAETGRAGAGAPIDPYMQHTYMPFVPCWEFPSSPGLTPKSSLGSKASPVITASGQSVSSSTKKPDISKVPSATSATNEGVLANFFNTLLTKKAGTPVISPLKGEKNSLANADAAMELDRMLKQTQQARPPQPVTSDESETATS